MSAQSNDGRGRSAGLRPAGLVAGLAAGLLLFTGCVGMSGPASLARQVRGVDGVEMNRVFGIDVGGTLANLALAVASQESGIDLTAGRIDRVEVGIYELTRTPADRHSLFDAVEEHGWTPCVRVRSPREEVRVLLRADESTLSGVAVLVRDGSDLVIARVSGDLAPLAETAVRLAADETRRELAREGLMRHAREQPDGSKTLHLTDRAAEAAGLAM